MTETTENPNRFMRWLGFFSALFLAFYGIHLMKESSWFWLWFVPMLLPFLGVLQLESERPIPLGMSMDPKKRPGKTVRHLGIWSAWIVAFFGIYLMIESSAAWYWFIPLLVPFLILLPQKMKEWEQEDEDKERRKAERKAARAARSGSSPIWRFLKVVFWIGVLLLAWQWVGFYIWMWVLGLAR